MKFLVTGGSGMLGHCLMRLAALKHQVAGSYHNHPVHIDGCSLYALDIANEAEVRSCFTSVRPDVVVHTAALTDVDECEKSPDKARKINSDGTAIVAKTCRSMGARLIYISTDYVFDGDRGGYCETDAPGPVNEYGRTKLLGESYAREYCPRVVVIRTTMFGLKLPPRVGMMESMVKALREGRPMTRFFDQYFTPLYTAQLSEVLIRMAELELTGDFHVGSTDKLSRLEFSKKVAAVFAYADSSISAGPFRQIEGLARRPKDTSLISNRIKERLRIALPEVGEGLRRLKQDWESVRGERMAAY